MPGADAGLREQVSDAEGRESPVSKDKPLNGASAGMALAVLTAIYTLSVVDRQIVNILAETIKRDLGLSDAQLGLITGLSFAVFYATLGIPIARLAERRNRPAIIATSVLVWSIFTMLCGAAGNLVQLVLARIGVGVGEAGSTPPSHALIADYFPRERRASAIGVFSLGAALGSMIGLAVGGVAEHLVGWRGAFMVAGVPGVAMAIVAILVLPEPRRRGIQPRAAYAPRAEGLSLALTTLFAVRSFKFLVAGMTLFSLFGYASSAFAGAFLFRTQAGELAALSAAITRVFGVDVGASGVLGLSWGLAGGLGAAIGMVMGGRLADRVGKRRRAFYAEIGAWSAFSVIPCQLLFLSAPSLLVVMAASFVSALIGSLMYGPIYGSIQSIVPAHLRATASACTLLIVNVVGLGMGPLSVGLLSDHLATAGMGPAEGLRYALLMILPLALIAAGASFLLCRRSISDDLLAQTTREEEAEAAASSQQASM